MVRPQITASDVGTIDVRQLASGRYRARASNRGDSEAPHRLAVTADTRDEAVAEIHRQARAMATGGAGALSRSRTITDAVELWLSQVLIRAKAGSLSYSTYESYETMARVIIVPRCGRVRLDRLCDRILQRILEGRDDFEGSSCPCGVEPTVRLRRAGRRNAAEPRARRSTPADVSAQGICPHACADQGHSRAHAGVAAHTRGRPPAQLPRPDRQYGHTLIGTSLRVGECLSLRRCDVDMTTLPPTLIVSGTIVSTKAQGTHRKNFPKRSR